MLTNRETVVLAYLREFESEHGYMPTYRQICEGCGWRSASTPYYYVQRLESKGHIRRTNYVCRSIRLTDLGRQALGTNGQECASEAEGGGQPDGGAE